MKVTVIKGYVGFNRKVYGQGTVLDMEKTEAARLLSEGVVAAAGENAQPTAVEAATVEDTPADEMTLPDANPAAAIKRGSKK